MSQFIPTEVYREKLAQVGRTTDEMREQSAVTFSGPSIELHHWALEARENVDPDGEAPARQAFLRATYAVLPAWGMHRMGGSRTKMPDFATFARGVEAAWPRVKALWRAKPPLSPNQWALLEEAYQAISARADSGGSQIVSRSKVLAHLLPDICAPIDREYTLSFFGIRTCHQHRVNNWPDYEIKLYRELHERFFHVGPGDSRCEALLGALVAGDRFNTSHMKALDNLIVANT